MILESLEIDPRTLEHGTGWAMKPEGLCKDGICVPFSSRGADGIDARTVASALTMPLVEDAEAGLWALGPRAGGRALGSAKAPDLALPDLDGRPFHLSSLRGHKVLLVAWAPW